MEVKEVHNALKERRSGALDKKANYRSALKPPSILAIGNKNPDRTYRWISKNMLDRFGGFDRRGWNVLNEKNSKGETLDSPYGSYQPHSDFRVDDVVAAFMPKEMADQKKAELLDATQAVRANLRNFRGSTRQAGGRVTGTVEVQKNGITEEL